MTDDRVQPHFTIDGDVVLQHVQSAEVPILTPDEMEHMRRVMDLPPMDLEGFLSHMGRRKSTADAIGLDGAQFIQWQRFCHLKALIAMGRGD